jgi:hypothetical protein
LLLLLVRRNGSLPGLVLLRLLLLLRTTSSVEKYVVGCHHRSRFIRFTTTSTYCVRRLISILRKVMVVLGKSLLV